jgi:nicotinate-nucleotide adenylyltransferase
MKLALFGGSFNPPHVGHLIVIESVRETLRFDKVLFIPSAQTPNKQNSVLAPAAARLTMTQLAVEHNSAFEVSDIEIQRRGISFTIDTINAVAALYPRASLSLIIGADNLLEFETWKDPDDILAKAELVVMTRPGYDQRTIDSRLARIAKMVNVPAIGISSTDIRRRVKIGRSIAYLVPQKVHDFIIGRRLYHD